MIERREIVGRHEWHAVIGTDGLCVNIGQGTATIGPGETVKWFVSEAAMLASPEWTCSTTQINRQLDEIAVERDKSDQAYAGKEANARAWLAANPTPPGDPHSVVPDADVYPWLRIPMDVRGWDAWTAAQSIIDAATQDAIAKEIARETLIVELEAS